MLFFKIKVQHMSVEILVCIHHYTFFFLFFFCVCVKRLLLDSRDWKSSVVSFILITITKITIILLKKTTTKYIFDITCVFEFFLLDTAHVNESEALVSFSVRYLYAFQKKSIAWCRAAATTTTLSV